MSKLIVSRMDICGTLCDYTALMEGGRLLEFHFQPVDQKSILDNIYVGQVENVVKHIQGAFIKISKDLPCYCDLKEEAYAIYCQPKKNPHMVPGDQLLVQVNRDAMKSKQPSVTTNLNLKGKYLILTTGKTGLGISGKITGEEKVRLRKWLGEELCEDYGLVVRTNAQEASKEELLTELKELKKQREELLRYGTARTCFSLVREREAFYISVIRNSYIGDLEEIVTDVPELHGKIEEYLEDQPWKETAVLRLYKDNLLPLYKLYSIEKNFKEICQEKVWLKSGGFLVIEPTEAFVSIDVNTGKYTGKKKAQETYRKINLEAAAEIARQLRARNLSGIILVDFINMENPDHNEELLNVLQKHLRKDPVKAIVHGMTRLKIVEITRKKIEKPLHEELKELRNRELLQEKR